MTDTKTDAPLFSFLVFSTEKRARFEQRGGQRAMGDASQMGRDSRVIVAR